MSTRVKKKEPVLVFNRGLMKKSEELLFLKLKWGSRSRLLSKLAASELFTMSVFALEGE